MLTPQNETMIERAKAGDRTALETLLLTHADILSTHISLRLPGALSRIISVEDVMQDALMKAFLKIDRLQVTTTTGFVAWLKAIAEMSIMGFMKAENRQKRGGKYRHMEHAVDSMSGSIVALIDKLPSEAATASQSFARREAIVAMRIGVASLPDDQRRAIRLHLLEGKSLGETGEAMGRTTGAIRALVHRGKKELAEVMGRASLWLSHR